MITGDRASRATPSEDTTRPDDLARQLAPTRRAALEAAEAAGQELLAEAHADADRETARAESEVAEALATARRRAEATRRARDARAVANARRERHTAMLRAEAEFVAELRARVHDAVHALVDDPRYPGLLDRLEQLARAQLGPDATIDRDPARGVVGRCGRRRVDYTLDTLADRAADAIGEEVRSAWWGTSGAPDDPEGPASEASS